MPTCRVPRALAPGFARFISRVVVVDEKQVLLLVACTAGQDRTGFRCALILLALGAGRSLSCPTLRTSGTQSGRTDRPFAKRWRKH